MVPARRTCGRTAPLAAPDASSQPGQAGLQFADVLPEAHRHHDPGAPTAIPAAAGAEARRTAAAGAGLFEADLGTASGRDRRENPAAAPDSSRHLPEHGARRPLGSSQRTGRRDHRSPGPRRPCPAAIQRAVRKRAHRAHPRCGNLAQGARGPRPDAGQQQLRRCGRGDAQSGRRGNWTRAPTCDLRPPALRDAVSLPRPCPPAPHRARVARRRQRNRCQLGCRQHQGRSEGVRQRGGNAGGNSRKLRRTRCIKDCLSVDQRPALRKRASGSARVGEGRILLRHP